MAGSRSSSAACAAVTLEGGSGRRLADHQKKHDNVSYARKAGGRRSAQNAMLPAT